MQSEADTWRGDFLSRIRVSAPSSFLGCAELRQWRLLRWARRGGVLVRGGCGAAAVMEARTMLQRWLCKRWRREVALLRREDCCAVDGSGTGAAMAAA